MVSLDRLWKFIACVAIALVLTLGGVGNSWAQEVMLPDRPPEARPNNGIDSSNIPSEKVNQFVSACLQVVALIDRREGSLQGAETESESLRIEQEIEAEALAIIEKTGLTRQEYIQLLGLANTDPEFGERVAVQLQEATS